MGIGAQGTGGLGDRSGRAQLVIQEVAESRVAGAATSEGSSSFNVERKDVLFKLMTDIPGCEHWRSTSGLDLTRIVRRCLAFVQCQPRPRWTYVGRLWGNDAPCLGSGRY